MELIRSALYYWKSVLHIGGTYEREMYKQAVKLEIDIPNYNKVITEFNDWYNCDAEYRDMYYKYYDVSSSSSDDGADDAASDYDYGDCDIKNVNFIYVEYISKLYHVYEMQKYVKPSPTQMVYILKNKYGNNFFLNFIHHLRSKRVYFDSFVYIYKDLHIEDIDNALYYALNK